MPRTPHTLDQVLAKLHKLENKDRLKGKAHYGINVDNALGLTMPEIRGIAKIVTKNHELAEALWQAGLHETRLIASMIDHPKWVTEDQMERWVVDFDSWDMCDQTCGELFDKTSFVTKKIHEWSARDEEYVKRAGFVLIAWHAVHDKKRDDKDFLQFLPLIERESTDSRNFVKKAVNWALRQIGKRSAALHPHGLALSEKLAASDNKTARWIGNDAARELKSEKVLKRLGL